MKSLVLHPTRRTLLQGLGLVALAALLPPASAPRARAAPPTGPRVLTTRTGTAHLLEPGEPATPIWGYDGAVPGPLIRVKQGGEVWVRLDNRLSQGTTIHWHGIRIDNRMDGVAGLTQAPVAPNTTFDYRFRVPDAGTFWYHPHNRTWEQLARGLYGMLIVEEPEPVPVDREIALVFDDWLLGRDGAIHEASMGSIAQRAHGGRIGNVLTVNSQSEIDLPVRTHERIRLRLLNACNARILRLRFEDVAVSLIAIDGQPVPPTAIADGLVGLAPASRADLALTVTGAPGSRAAITEISRERVVIGRFSASQSPPLRPAPLATPIVLPANRLAEPDIADGLARARKVDLVMTGGAMGRMFGAIYKGKPYRIRELVRRFGQVWAFNGVAGMPEKPLFSARRGETVAVRMVNRTAWPHAMHFHGHHFRVVGEDGRIRRPYWHDTVLLQPDETLTAAFKADNPGKWMIHCHMVEHQAGGMATWFEVRA